MARETNQVLGHGDEADGIEEYDNPLPDWWLGLFILTVIYGIGYAINYHFISGDSQENRYLAEMAAAEKQWPTPEGPVKFVMDDAMVADGEGIYQQTCASCHNADMTGGIGPNLVDAEWIHGGDPDAIIKTVTEGVAAKGMPAWGPILGPQKVQAVTAFIVSKKGSAPAVAANTDADANPATDAVAATDAGTPEPEVEATPEAAGAEIYATNCAACHGPEMKGLVGPNLVDDEWIHGNALDDIKKTITDGVPEKGMTSWGPILGEEKIDLVARYVQMKSNGTL